MSQTNLEMQVDTGRKPRLALMGEFSAGKSTLANALMGKTMSPTQITATQLPPIWYTHGDGESYAEMQDGTKIPLRNGFDTLDPTKDIRAVHVFSRCAILEACDIIDMPGSSDPNMDADTWQSMLPLADGVLWCTPATQAWRQSEAAIWESVPSQLWSRSLLLLTRIDKIGSERDKDKIVRRVRSEAGELFRSVLPVSLLEATRAGANPEAWQSSGAAQIIDQLLDIVSEIAQSLDPSGAADEVSSARQISFKRDEEATCSPAPQSPPEENHAQSGAPTVRVMPRRVIRASGAGSSRIRPRRESNRESVI